MSNHEHIYIQDAHEEVAEEVQHLDEVEELHDVVVVNDVEEVEKETEKDQGDVQFISMDMDNPISAQENFPGVTSRGAQTSSILRAPSAFAMTAFVKPIAFKTEPPEVYVID